MPPFLPYHSSPSFPTRPQNINARLIVKTPRTTSCSLPESRSAQVLTPDQIGEFKEFFRARVRLRGRRYHVFSTIAKSVVLRTNRCIAAPSGLL
jgi:hypothetical protein